MYILLEIYGGSFASERGATYLPQLPIAIQFYIFLFFYLFFIFICFQHFLLMVCFYAGDRQCSLKHVWHHGFMVRTKSSFTVIKLECKQNAYYKSKTCAIQVSSAVFIVCQFSSNGTAQKLGRLNKNRKHARLK